MKITFWFLLILASWSVSYCQVANDSILIDSIHYEGVGGRIAKNAHLITLLSTGEKYSTIELEEACQDLLNTRLFSKVSFQIDQKSDKNILTFNCVPVWAQLPILTFGHAAKAPFIEVGYRDLNFLRRFGIFKAYTIHLNDQFSFYQYAEIPFILKSSFGIKFKFNDSKLIENILISDQNYSYNLHNRNLTFGSFYQFNPFHKIAFSLGGISQTFTPPAENGIPSRKESAVQFIFEHELQYVDFSSVFADGWRTESEFIHSEGQKVKHFSQFISTTSYYKRILKKGNLAIRGKLGLASKKLGAFGPFTVDSYFNLRGAGYQVDRGIGQIVLNLEYRQLLFKSRFACLQAVVFNDTGNWRKNQDDALALLYKNEIKSFSGVGLRLFVADVYDLIFRVDYAISMFDNQKNGLVFGIGQYF